MSAKNFAINVNGKNATTAEHLVEAGAGAKGQPTVIRLQGPSRLDIVDRDTGYAPHIIAAKRSGNKLLIALENGDIATPDVVVENFYDEENNGAAVLGRAESGQFFEYIPTSGEQASYVPLLSDEATAVSALGGAEVSSAEAGGIPLVGVLAGIGFLALGASAGGAAIVIPAAPVPPTPVPDVPAPGAPTSYRDNVGAIISNASTAPVTDDSTPGINIGANLSGTFKLYVDGTLVAATYDPATGTLTPNTPLADGRHVFSYTVTNAQGTESPKSPALAITVDTTAPTASGGKNYEDNVGSVQSPASTATTTDDPTPGINIGTGITDTPKLYVDGVKVEAVYNPTTGTLTPVAPIKDGTHEITYTVIDPVGNESVKSQPLPIIIDTSVPVIYVPPVYVPPELPKPAKPTSYDDNIGPVKDIVSTAPVTDDNKPGINVGVGLPGTLTLYVDGKSTPATYDPKTGTLTPDEELKDGPHEFTFTRTDTAGTTSPKSDPLNLIIDTAAPAGASLLTAITLDTGTAGDFVTSDKALIVSGTNGALAAGETVQVSLDGGATWKTAASPTPTTWSLDATEKPLDDGTYTFQTRIVDAAGLPGPIDSQTVVIDSTNPAKPAKPVNYDDNIGLVKDAVSTAPITDDNKPGVNIPKGLTDKPDLYVDGKFTPATYDPLTGTLTPDEKIDDGLHVFTYTVTDKAGNVSPPSDPLNITIDTSVPAGTSLIKAITLDSGKGDDFITNDTNLVVSGTNGTLAAGEKVQVSLDNGVTWREASSPTPTTWTFDATATKLAEGTHTFQTRIVDASGQLGTPTSQTVVIDATAPTATSTITAITNDTGVATDFVTSDNALIVSGINAALNPGETIQVSLDNGVSWLPTVSPTATTWTLDATSKTLPDGAYTFQTRVIDVAGSTGPVSSKPVTIDTAAPTATSTITTITNDTGTAGDFVTSDKTLIVGGTNTALNAGEIVQVSLDNGLNWLPTAPVNGTTWTLDATSKTLADGTHTFQTRVIDVAGSTGPVANQVVTINSAPPTSGSLITAITNDTGTGGDFITSDKTLVVSGTNAALKTGETLQVSLDNGTTWQPAASATATTWTLDATNKTLADGTYTFQTRILDITGTTGPVSSQVVVIDATAPTATSTITAISVDSGTPADYVTNDNTLVVSGTNAALNPGETIQVSLDNGASWLPANSSTATTWTLNATNKTLADGTHTFQTRVIDVAGSTGPVSNQTVVIDATAPTATSTITAISNDSGTAGDFITSDNTLVVSGSNSVLNAGETVQVSMDNGASWLPAATASATTWTLNATSKTLADGNYTFQTRVVDVAGSTGPMSKQDVTIANAPPTTGSLITAISTDTGAVGDFVTSDNQLLVSGTNAALKAGDSVQVSLDNGTTWLPAVSSTPTTWSLDATSKPLANGNYTFQTRILDVSGQTGPASTKAVVIDTAAPTATSTITAITNDTGVATDFVTSDNALIVSGINAALNPGETIQVSLDNGASWLPTVSSTATTWTLDATSKTLPDGAYTFQTRVIDVAGSTGPVSSKPVTIDTAAPTATSTITTITNDTGTGGDFVTSDKTLIVGGTNTALNAGEIVQVSLDNGLNWLPTAPVNGTTWTLDATSKTLADGTHTFQTRVIDVAGSTGPVANQVVTINSAPPTSGSVITAITNDTGTAGDFVTSDNQLIVSGTNAALKTGETVQVSLDNGTTWQPAASSTSTTWTLDATNKPLANGNYTFQTRIVDDSGLAGPATSKPVVIDTIVPTATSTITAITNDTGIGTDFITSDNKLIVGGTNTALNAGEIVQVSMDNGVSWLPANSATATTWTLDATNKTLADGNYTFQTRVIDVAGLTGPVATKPVTIDATAPTATSTITTITNDSGTPGDFTTNDTTLVVGGKNDALNPGEKVQVSLDNGTTWTNAASASATTWTLDATTLTPLTEGPHTFQTRVVDVAGSTGPVANQVVTIDTVVPMAVVAFKTSTHDQANQYTIDEGDWITLTVTMPTAVTVDTAGGSPKLGIDIGGTTQQALFDSVSGNVLTFKYHVVDADFDHDGVSVSADQLTLNGAVIKDASGNAAPLTHNAVAGDTDYRIDTIDIGAKGLLVNGYQAEGKWYFGGDSNSDGVATSEYTWAQANALNGQTINGVTLTLPGVGISPVSTGNKPGTAVSDGLTVNPTYDGLLAIWDARNGSGTGIEDPATIPWNGELWSSDASTAGKHFTVYAESGYVEHLIDTSRAGAVYLVV